MALVSYFATHVMAVVGIQMLGSIPPMAQVIAKPWPVRFHQTCCKERACVTPVTWIVHGKNLPPKLGRKNPSTSTFGGSPYLDKQSMADDDVSPSKFSSTTPRNNCETSFPEGNSISHVSHSTFHILGLNNSSPRCSLSLIAATPTWTFGYAEDPHGLQLVQASFRHVMARVNCFWLLWQPNGIELWLKQNI